jgi:hydrogenase maturation protease
MHTRILCLGNELVKDDGVGIRIGRILLSLPLPANARVELTPQLGYDLLDAVAGAERIVLVDAMSTGRKPGTCVVMEGQAIERYSAGTAVSHTIGIAELMTLAQRLVVNPTPAKLYFVGVEGGAFDGYGIDLSPDVMQALPEAVDAVLQIVGASNDLRRMGKQASLAAMEKQPTVGELLGG